MIQTEEYRKTIVSSYQSGKTYAQVQKEYGVFSSALSNRVREYFQVKLALYAQSDKRPDVKKMTLCLVRKHCITISGGRVYRLMKRMRPLLPAV